MTQHKSGFVSIIGKPNVGKSTLMNRLVGEKISIITSKAQTTRHRIKGIISGKNFQIVYSDTPGVLTPKYALHQSMMSFVNHALEDADIILFVTDIYEKHNDEQLIRRIVKAGVPVILILNKIDLAKEHQVDDKMKYWTGIVNPRQCAALSALEGIGIEELFNSILTYLPVHPPYFPKEALTDMPERFFVSEIVREKIFLHYNKEVPYSSEVVVSDFKEEKKMIKIRVEICVERKSQRAILLGHKGERIKQAGTEARKDIEQFFGKKVFLQQHVKVQENWRRNAQKLHKLGYTNR